MKCFIGADSRLGTERYDGGTNHKNLTCKIEQLSSDQFAAFSGTVFSVYYDARKVAKRTVDLAAPNLSPARFEAASMPLLQETAEQMVKKDGY